MGDGADLGGVGEGGVKMVNNKVRSNLYQTLKRTMKNIEVLRNIRIANQLSKEKEKLLENAPFHFNLIDEVKANENAHSKIIGKLLRYKEHGEFMNLISFLDQIGLGQTFKNPRISIEKDRIDVTILGKDYAIIIENKIHYATDQDKQISRYVDIIKSKNYPINQIYVLYLTRWGHKKVEKKSLDDDLRKELGNRFIPINFKDHILPWVEDVLTKCRQRDQDLIHGLKQYIDHLKGMFNQRKKFEKMNKELNEMLAKEIKLTGTTRERNAIIENKLEEFELCITHLNSLREGIRNDLRKEFLGRLFKKLNDYEPGWNCVNRLHEPKTVADANAEFFGFSNKTYQYKNTELIFSVEIYKWGHFFCGVYCKDTKVREQLRSEFGENKINMFSTKNRNWLYLGLTNYKYGNCEPALNVYDDQYNISYIEEMDIMVNIFYTQVIKVFKAWKKIAKKRDDL